MNEAEWLAKAERNKDVIIELITRWHPKSKGYSPTNNMPITAPNAEYATEQVRRMIQSEVKTDPIEDFKKALKDKDIPLIMSILNQAWFGVPESTACWRIKGFSEAVMLLEDPPEEEDSSDVNS